MTRLGHGFSISHHLSREGLTKTADFIASLGFAFLALFPCLALADSPAPPQSYTLATPDKRHVFVMIAPSEPGVSCPSRALRCRYPQSGLYRNDGSTTPLWTVDWYTSHVIVSSDARHLVRFPSWTSRGPDAHGLTFLADGREIRSYRVRDLVSAWQGIQETASHMWWIEDLKLDEESKRLILTAKTKDVTVFDLATGNIVDAVRSRHCEPEGILASDPVAPGDCTFALKQPGNIGALALPAGTQVVVGADKTLRNLRAARLAEGGAYGGIRLPAGTVVVGGQTLRLQSVLTAGGLALTGEVQFYGRGAADVTHVVAVREHAADRRPWFGVPFSPGKVSVFGAEADDVAFVTRDARIVGAEFGKPTVLKGVDVAGRVELRPDGTPVGSQFDRQIAAAQEFDRNLLSGLWTHSGDDSPVCRDHDDLFSLSLSPDGKTLTIRPEPTKNGARAVSASRTESARVVSTTGHSLIVAPLTQRTGESETTEFAFIAPGVFRTRTTPPTGGRETLGVRCPSR